MESKERAKKTGLSTFFRFIALLALVLAGSISYWALAPDYQLSFTRSMPSKLDRAALNRQISSTHRWPNWFYSLQQVKVIDPATSQPSPQVSSLDVAATSPADETTHADLSLVQAGQLLQLDFDPNRGTSKKFFLWVQVVEWIPESKLSFRVIKDSTGRLTHLLSDLRWEVTLEPKTGGTGTQITGHATAMTHHWRARFLGSFAEKILMHQVFYPNILKLAELEQPFSLDETVSPLGVGGS